MQGDGLMGAEAPALRALRRHGGFVPGIRPSQAARPPHSNETGEAAVEGTAGTRLKAVPRMIWGLIMFLLMNENGGSSVSYLS